MGAVGKGVAKAAVAGIEHLGQARRAGRRIRGHTGAHLARAAGNDLETGRHPGITVQRGAGNRFDMRQRRLLAAQPLHEFIQRLAATPGLDQHPAGIVPYLAGDTAFPCQPPDRRPESDALHNTGYPDAFPSCQLSSTTGHG